MTDLIQKLQSDEFYITLETTPSKSPTIDNILSEIEKYDLQNRVLGFSVTDNPLAKMKYSSTIASIKLQSKFNRPVICTLSMRDKNKIALQSDLLGLNDFDVTNILALTGDPTKLSDQPHAKGVFEANSSLLLQIIKSFNEGLDFSSKPFNIKPKTINGFSVVNSHAKNFNTLKKKMFDKVSNYSCGIITQPVYDVENAKKLLEIFEEVVSTFDDERKNAKLILGVFPITKFRTAQFLSAHVPGIFVPDDWISKLSSAKSISDQKEIEIGLEMSKELFEDIKKLHPKIHLMTANNFDIADKII
jgi:methylenetetrahydrofolate reductase (NADPH)